MFLRPARKDILLISQMLKIFGHASGLDTNLSKRSICPINCSSDDLLLLYEVLECEIKDFPCKYLGISLTLRKPTRSDLLPLIDKVAANLPKWKASLLNRAGRLVVVHAVLTAIPMHLMAALDIPKWAIRVIDKLQSGFLWTGRQNANGGTAADAVWRAWDPQPPIYGLGITYSLVMVAEN